MCLFSTYLSLLPPTNEVWGKVMFLYVSVIPVHGKGRGVYLQSRVGVYLQSGRGRVVCLWRGVRESAYRGGRVLPTEERGSAYGANGGLSIKSDSVYRGDGGSAYREGLGRPLVQSHLVYFRQTSSRAT